MKAFPKAYINCHDEENKGMDLRDYFAAKALEGMTTLTPEEWYKMYKEKEGSMIDMLPKIAYQFADEMMKAREK